ncbi:MAG: hypothetical protein ACTSWY_00350 [Promethearchaeota archaeon]
MDMDTNLKIKTKYQTLRFIKNLGPINFQQMLSHINNNFRVTTKESFLCLNELVVEQKIRKIDNYLSISKGIFIETIPEPVIFGGISKFRKSTNDFRNRLFSLVPDRKQNPDSPPRLPNDLLNKFQKITNKMVRTTITKPINDFSFLIKKIPYFYSMGGAR